MLLVQNCIGGNRGRVHEHVDLCLFLVKASKVLRTRFLLMVSDVLTQYKCWFALVWKGKGARKVRDNQVCDIQHGRLTDECEDETRI